MTGTTLLTGADGYLGRRLAASLLANTGDDLLLTVRASSPDEFAAKRGGLAAGLGPAAEGRVRYAAADLSQESALEDLEPGDVTTLVHAAAVTRFNVEEDLAHRVNIEGTRRVTAFARRCPRLRRFALLSTLYASGRHEGDITEERLPDKGFVNHYEWSKWSAEDHVLNAAGELPVSVLRLPTLIADNNAGAVTQYNAFHNTLKLYYYGLLSLVPGDPSTPLSLATADFTVAAVSRLLEEPVPDGVYHLCPDPADTAPLGALIDTAFTVFESDRAFLRRGLLRPVHCDEAAFNDLLYAAHGFKGGPIEQSLSSVSPFAAQLYLPKNFRNEALRSAWPGYAAPGPLELVEATCGRLIASKWGRYSKETP